MRYRLLIAYDGSEYAGWQRQDNALAIQQVVEEAVAAVASRSVAVHGAGRTDAGVHASGQAAHLDLPAGNLPPRETRRALVHGVNHHLPGAIRVLAADAVDDSFHARRSASFKVYGYRLCRAPVIDPFRAPFVVPAPRRLDLEAMKKAASLIRGRHDFSAFAKAGGGHGGTVRTIREARWAEQGDEIRFRVAGGGFLRGMVRALVGTTLEVGLGRRTPDDLAALLAGRPRAEAGPNAPARGLCLERVEYDHPQ